MAGLHGFLNIHKPEGLTSAEIVNRVKSVCRQAVRKNRIKVGHCGTLDPMATGVLVICVGHASRLQEILHERPKSYVARFELGRETNTEDRLGETTQEFPLTPESISPAAIEAVLPEFVGTIPQVPPVFSSISVNGRRAYKIARKGNELLLDARDIDVHELQMTGYEFPYFDLRISCGAGTYVRSLGRDIGRRLGCGATLSALVRTSVGPFELEHAIDIDAVRNNTVMGAIQPALKGVEHLPLRRVNSEIESVLRTGAAIPEEHTEVIHAPAQADDRVGVVGEHGALIAIAVVRPDSNDIKPVKVLPAD